MSELDMVRDISLYLKGLETFPQYGSDELRDLISLLRGEILDLKLQLSDKE